ncbi:MAG: hypothetical protein ACYS67_17050 [Planctomycetota bacterium]|jgi:hypothetical protein
MKIQSKINNHSSLIIWLGVLYYCRETFTDVMSALQIKLFMQNKPNFLGDQMNVSSFITMNYEQRTMNCEIKTNPIQTQFKPNSNPIQSQFKPKQTQFPNFPGQYFLMAIPGKNKYADKNDAKRYETV